MKSIFILLAFNLAWSNVVIVDPGHGGDELGAIGKYKVNGKSKTVYEKDLTLKFAQILKQKLEPKHTVYLTRSFDKTLGLNERANLADKVKADLFISLHFNSNLNSQYSGFETYYLDNKRNKATNKVEKIENQDLSGEELVVNQILIDLAIKKTAKASRRLGMLVHEQIKKDVKNSKLRDRGLKPGLFYVLALSKRPGLLIEAAFMSNPTDLRLVMETSFLDEYAVAVAKGIEMFLKK